VHAAQGIITRNTPFTAVGIYATASVLISTLLYSLDILQAPLLVSACLYHFHHASVGRSVKLGIMDPLIFDNPLAEIILDNLTIL
jgi:hypothetical protein